MFLPSVFVLQAHGGVLIKISQKPLGREGGVHSSILGPPSIEKTLFRWLLSVSTFSRGTRLPDLLDEDTRCLTPLNHSDLGTSVIYICLDVGREGKRRRKYLEKLKLYQN